jgi:predicted flap endonuclease-1-like 5' DNA nuclease
MAWISSVTRSVTHGVQGLAAGVWAAVATPLVYTPLRPLTKQALKGGFWLARGAQSLLETTQDEWDDIVTEARAEVRSGEEPPRLEADASAVDPDGEPVAAEPASRPADEARADLTDVKGIGEDYARLLRAAGISSVQQLATSDAGTLRETLRDTNQRENLVGRVPSTDRIRDWVEQAAEHAG